MTQSIFVQVGQCGNQLGHKFWDLALKEHIKDNKRGIFDDALNSFFRNVDSSTNQDIGNVPSKICSLKARAVLVDMEEGVLNASLKGPLGSLFDHSQIVADVSGSGNNWSVGHHEYGPKYRGKILQTVRKAAEQCDYLQCFFILHSMGGGTGSGLGTFVLNLLKDEFPDVYRFVTAVFPSTDDDVVTSPYNSVLAMRQLTDSADCVLPVENEALIGIVNKYDKCKKEVNVFDSMNSIVANMLLNLTSSSRFQGEMNVDLNEITMNMVPFPRLHYLSTGISPIFPGLVDPKVDQHFVSTFERGNQLTSCDPKRGTFLACALFARGDISITDMRRNVDRFKEKFRFVSWNRDAWKTGHCRVPPAQLKRSLLSLSNTSALSENFKRLHDKCTLLYRRKAHLHHYTCIEGMESNYIDDCLVSLEDLIGEYQDLDDEVDYCHTEPRIQIIN